MEDSDFDNLIPEKSQGAAGTQVSHASMESSIPGFF